MRVNNLRPRTRLSSADATASNRAIASSGSDSPSRLSAVDCCCTTSGSNTSISVDTSILPGEGDADVYRLATDARGADVDLHRAVVLVAGRNRNHAVPDESDLPARRVVGDLGPVPVEACVDVDLGG